MRQSDWAAKGKHLVQSRLQGRYRWFWLLPLLLLGLAPVQGALARRSRFLGYHPEAQAQPSDWGKSLHTLHLHGDQLYLGYGDYSQNTGPIAVRSYSLTTQTFSTVRLTAQTEAVHQWRSIGQQVFGIMADANFSPSQGGYFSGGSASGDSASKDSGLAPKPWAEAWVGPAIHSYDMAKHGNALYLSGAGSATTTAPASLYKSTDAGATWQLDFELSPPEGGYGRFYGIQGLQGQLYAFATQTVGHTSQLEIYRHRGDRWQKISKFDDETDQGSSMMDLVSWAGVLIGRNNPSGLAPGQMHAFDGRRLVEVSVPGKDGGKPVWTYDHIVANGALYALTSDFRIVKTVDLRRWKTVIANTTHNARSLAVVTDCEIYIGGVEADLYRYGSCAAGRWGISFR